MLSVGSTFAERFRIDGRAGVGGMAVVYRATDLMTNVPVALKIMHDTGDMLARFEREIAVLERLRHPGIAQYIAHGTENAQPFLAMEWIEGPTLAARLREGPLSPIETLTLGKSIAQTLIAVHEQGIVHRDLKPANLILRAGVADVVVLDFGVARVSGATMQVSMPGMLVGTPSFVSPEQARGALRIDARSDVFALGSVLFFCLTGRAPYRGDDALAILAKIVFEGTPRVRDEWPAVPPDLDHVLATMMAKSPDDRFQNMRAVVEVLRQVEDATLDRPQSTAGISRTEARLCSIVLAGRQGQTPVRHAVEEATTMAARHGGDALLLANGILAIRWLGRDVDASPGASAVDRAMAAARCALAIRDKFPSLPICLATMRGAEGVIARAIDVAAELARAPAQTTVSMPPVRIDATTHEIVGDAFETEAALGALFLHGERKHDAARTLLGVATPCVGRDRELLLLDATLDQTIEEDRPHAVVVTGDAGMGKSRLRREWLGRLRARATPPSIVLARADALGARSPYSVIAGVLRRVAGVLDNEPLETRVAKLREYAQTIIAVNADAERMGAFFCEIAGAPIAETDIPELVAARSDVQLMGHHQRQAVVQWIVQESRNAPCVWVLEDTHLIDAATLRAIDDVLRRDDVPVMVLALGRTPVEEWRDRRMQQIKLSELSKRSAERLVRSALADLASDDIVQRIVELGNGNPFFLEELVRSIYEGRSDALPESVLAVLEARIERLDADARRVLRAASIFGDRFWRSGVKAVLGRTPDAMLDGWLADLLEREVIVRAAQPRFADESEYAFRHVLVRDATYSMLTPKDQVAGHLAAAEWLTSMGERDAGVLAMHYQRGGQNDRAADAMRVAAERCLSANDFAQAIDLAQMALASDPPAAILPDLYLVQAEAYRWLGDEDASQRWALAAIDRAQRGTSAWARATAGGALALLKVGDIGQSEILIDDGVRALEAVSKPPQHLLAMGAAVGVAAMFAGLPDHARRARNAVLPHVPSMDGLTLASTCHLRAFYAEHEGDYQTQLESFEDAAVIMTEVGATRRALLARVNAHLARAYLGLYEEASEGLWACLAEADAQSLPMVSATIQCDLVFTLHRLSKFGDAIAMSARAAAAWAKIGDVRMEGATRLYVALAHLRKGDVEEALHEARMAQNLLQNVRGSLAESEAMLAYALLKTDNVSECLEHALYARDALAEAGARIAPFVGLVVARALARDGRVADARTALRAAYESVQHQASLIRRDDWRKSFLERPWENAQILEWARSSQV